MPPFFARSSRFPSELFDAVERGALVLTANARAARALHMAYAERQQQQGRAAWATPSIHDWQSWADALWHEAFIEKPELPLLLDPLQEGVIWKRIQQQEAAPVVSPDSMARLSQEAYKLLSVFDAHEQRRYSWASLDAEHFRAWATAFDSECARRGWASGSRCDKQLTTLVEEGIVPVPDELLCVGFDRISPSQQQLLDALFGRGTRAVMLPDAGTATATLVAANDFREEVAACAAWCRAQLETNPAARIGVLVPQLNSARAEIDRVFRNTLTPASSNIFGESNSALYEFSLGMPLASVPVVHAALLLLKWLSTPLPEEEVTWLLLSGFVTSGQEETTALASLDVRWRNIGALSPELPLSTVLRRLAHGVPGLRERLQRCIRMVPSKSDRWSGWVELAPRLLEAVGWPGHRPPGSAQYQAQRRFELLLDQLAALDYDASQTTFAEFVRTLMACAAETTFSLESENAPIQIMGAMESSGQCFDALWFLGVDDQAWPLTGSPHPLLPPQVQRNHQMPHSSPQQDWELARTVTARIAAAANICIFSYSRQNAEGELRCSPLITALIAGEAQPAATLLGSPAFPIAVLETITDDSGALAWPVHLSPGGSEVLRYQAACPFQAFATTRLHAAPLNRTERGLTSAERGKLLHKVLERVWGEHLQTRDDLLNTTAAGGLAPLLNEEIAAAFAPHIGEAADDIWLHTYLEAEQQRVLALLIEWLAIEAARGPFTVEQVEQRLENIDVNGLRLNLRADRIDRLPAGGHLLIDYKTGDVSASKWKGERPDEPQLPLYAVFGGIEDVRGVLFAQLRANQLKFEGLACSHDMAHFSALSKEQASIGDINAADHPENWESALHNLAADFLRGEAAVDPQHKATTCRYCHLHGLCRIAEINALAEEGTDD